MKKYLILAMGGLMLAACSNDDSLGTQQENLASENDGIAFGITLPNPTRASNVYTGKTAAEKLNRNFVVYGLKYYTKDEPTSLVDVKDAEKQQTVFDLYNVNYEDGTDKTTQSNTKGWEYVGYLSAGFPSENQTIRYWDYSATGYVFSAVSGTGITAQKVESGTTAYDKGWRVIVPAGGSLTDLYVSARQQMLKPTPQGTRYEEAVNLTFYSVLSKIRFAIYETIPGYNVHIDRFYYNNGASSSTTNFAVDGNFRVVKPDAQTEFVVSYYDNKTSIENRPKLTYDNASVLAPTYSLFGANIQATDLIGTTSDDATYDQAGGNYTIILPYQADDNQLSLRVDYTLKALNGNETIKVSGATATVPAKFLQWKENFAYTYIFKISDNTNGSTTPGGPEGLSPITFDGCVVADEEGVQETVTSVTEPSITTYQKGVVVTTNDEYAAGDIYYTMMHQGEVVMLDGSEVFEVNNLAAGNVTETLVMNHKTNYVLLTPVATTAVTAVPLSNGSSLTFAANQCYKFSAAEGKTYAIMKNDSCKLVKVVGTPTAPEFKLACKAGSKIKTQSGTVEVTISNTKGTITTSQGVLGAAKLLSVWQGNEDNTRKFSIKEDGAGRYTIKLTAEAITEGVDGDFTIKFNESVIADNTFNVSLGYAISPTNKLTVIAGKSASFQVTAGGSAVTKAVIDNSNEGITIEETAIFGTYKVSAATVVSTNDYNVKVAGQSYVIHVNHYDFSDAAVTLTWCEGTSAPTHTLVLTPEAQTVNIASSDASVVAGGNTNYQSKFVMTALKGGKTTLSYETAKCDVAVNKYELKSSASKINKSIGSTELTFECNETVQSAKSNQVKVSYSADNTTFAVADVAIYKLSTNRQKVVFNNITKAGFYKLEYIIKVSGQDTSVGTEIIEVTEP